MVHDAAFDYYGKRLATCSSDCCVKVFDVVGEQVRGEGREGRAGGGCSGAALGRLPFAGLARCCCLLELRRSALPWPAHCLSLEQQEPHSALNVSLTSPSRQVTHLADLSGHEGPVWQVAWAHPKFGSLLASCRCVLSPCSCVGCWEALLLPLRLAAAPAACAMLPLRLRGCRTARTTPCSQL